MRPYRVYLQRDAWCNAGLPSGSKSESNLRGCYEYEYEQIGKCPTEEFCPRIIFSWEVNFTLSAQEPGTNWGRSDPQDLGKMSQIVPWQSKFEVFCVVAPLGSSKRA